MALTRQRRTTAYVFVLLCALFAPFARAGAADPLVPSPSPVDCHYWMPMLGESLYQVVKKYTCVVLPAGVVEIPRQVNLLTARKLYGAGRDRTVIRAQKNFQGNSIFATNGSQGVVIESLTVDAAGVATGGLGATGMTVRDVRITGGKCWGVGVNGPNMVVLDSVIDRNGGSCPVAPPGAGAYITSAKARVVFERVVFEHNTGPAIDVNRAPHGRLVDSVFRGNTGWAALSLFGASRWVVRRNEIDHAPGGKVHKYHVFCDPGAFKPAPRGRMAAGILICHDSPVGMAMYNIVEDNVIKSGYGLLVLGADDVTVQPKRTKPWWVPRRNRFADNVVRDSVIPCADDLRPGQWGNDHNVWSGNDCLGGVPNTPPYYF